MCWLQAWENLILPTYAPLALTFSGYDFFQTDIKC